MAMQFKKATKAQAKLRMALDGPAGSGKTMSALKIARGLVPGGRVALIDTERGSASKYADEFEFDVLELETFSPDTYVDAINAAARGGYDVIIVDSLSHAWSGTGGALEIVDSNKDKFGGGWRKVTPMHNALVDTILRAPAHVLVTMRTKMEYVLEEIVRDGRKIQQPRKVGMKPIQREGMEYEFDVVGDIDLDHTLVVSKTRCSKLADRTFQNPGDAIAEILRAWLTDGTEYVPPAPYVADPEAAAHEALAAEFVRRIDGAEGAELSTIPDQAKAAKLPGAMLERVRAAYVARVKALRAATPAPVPSNGAEA